MDSFLKSAEEKVGGDGNQNDMVKQAEGFISDQSGGDKGSSGTPAPSGGDGKSEAKAPTSGGNADLMGNAKTLYQGIQDKMSGKSDVNDAQLAGAADDLLKAGSGMDKDGQYSEYFNKAEGYLQKYQQGGGGAPTSDSAPPKQ